MPAHVVTPSRSAPARCTTRPTRSSRAPTPTAADSVGRSPATLLPHLLLSISPIGPAPAPSSPPIPTRPPPRHLVPAPPRPRTANASPRRPLRLVPPPPPTPRPPSAAPHCRRRVRRSRFVAAGGDAHQLDRSGLAGADGPACHAGLGRSMPGKAPNGGPRLAAARALAALVTPRALPGPAFVTSA